MCSEWIALMLTCSVIKTQMVLLLLLIVYPMASYTDKTVFFLKFATVHLLGNIT